MENEIKKYCDERIKESGITDGYYSQVKKTLDSYESFDEIDLSTGTE